MTSDTVGGTTGARQWMQTSLPQELKAKPQAAAAPAVPSLKRLPFCSSNIQQTHAKQAGVEEKKKPQKENKNRKRKAGGTVGRLYVVVMDN